jgi:hypothetical protein
MSGKRKCNGCVRSLHSGVANDGSVGMSGRPWNCGRDVFTWRRASQKFGRNNSLDQMNGNIKDN